MPDAHPSSFDGNKIRWRRWGGGFVVFASIMLVACKGPQPLDLTTTHSIEAADEKPMLEAVVPNTAKAERTAKSPLRVSAFAPRPKPAAPNFDVSSTPELTARCRHILATSGAENALLRSPTLSTEIDDEGEVGVNLGYDVLDLRRAALKEELAIARCHQQNAVTKLTQMLITSPQALTRAGYLAKSNVLKINRKKVLRIRGKIDRALEDGDITLSRATLLRQYANQVLSLEASARGEAARRRIVDEFQVSDVGELDDVLIAAEKRIQQIQRKLRTVDALKVNVSGGYATSETGEDTLLGQDGDLSGKVKVSVRLGALSGTRKIFEDEAAAARHDALFEEGSSMFWRAGEIAKANRQAMKALLVQRKNIRDALKQARRSGRMTSDFGGTDLVGPALRSQLDSVALAADLAGIEATIADSRRIDRRLRFN